MPLNRAVRQAGAKYPWGRCPPGGAPGVGATHARRWTMAPTSSPPQAPVQRRVAPPLPPRSVRAPDTGRGSRTAVSGLLTLLALGLITLLAVWPLFPAAVVPASASPTDFSAERALPHLTTIAQEPRPEHPRGSQVPGETVRCVACRRDGRGIRAPLSRVPIVAICVRTQQIDCESPLTEQMFYRILRSCSTDVAPGARRRSESTWRRDLA